MTLPLFGENAYLKEAPAEIIGFSEENGIILDRSIFYPTGGGQPGDTGAIVFNGERFSVEETVKGENGNIILLLADGFSSLKIGDTIVTGGMSFYFPKGVPIGSISNYDNSSLEGYYDIDVEVFNDFSSLSTVYILERTDNDEIKTLLND